MKKLIFPLLLLLIFPGFGCASPSRADRPVRIGFCMDSLVIERWQKDRDAFTSEAEKLGVQVEVYNANGDLGVQRRQVRELIEQDVTAIVLIAIDSNAFVELVNMAHERQIPVVAYDRLIADANVDAFVSFDTENIGRYMAEELAKTTPSGNYVILGGSLLDQNMSVIAQGIHEELALRPRINLVAEVYCDNWSSSSAFDQLSAILKESTDVDAVLCGNDSLAVGAIRALSEYQLAGKVAVSGQDADLESCQRIVEGTQTMTVYKPLDQLGRKAAEVAVDLAKGQPVQGGESFNDGSYDIPRYAVATQIVTADNMAERIVSSGFHRLEDVYRNVPQEQWPAID